MFSPTDIAPYSVLIIEPDTGIRESLISSIAGICFTQEALSMTEAQDLLARIPVHVVLCNAELPDGDGVAFMAWIARLYPDTVRMLYGGTPSVECILAAINEGHIRYYLPIEEHRQIIPTVLEEAIEYYSHSSANSLLVEQLRSTNHLLERKVEQHTRELVALNEELRMVLDEMQRLVVVDNQTGLANRRIMTLRLEESFKQAKRYNMPLACMLCDIAHFKRWNDIYGHEECDNLLHDVALRIRKQIRDVDIAARAGGDEFCLILPHTDGAGAYVLAERLYREVVEQPYRISQRDVTITMHFGIAELTPSITSPVELFHHAEQAESIARQFDTRPSIVIYTDDIFQQLSTPYS